MKKCTNCGLINNDSSTSCTGCNNDLSIEYVFVCNKCGLVFSGDESTCKICGAAKPSAIFNVDNIKNKFASFTQSISNQIHDLKKDK